MLQAVHSKTRLDTTPFWTSLLFRLVYEEVCEVAMGTDCNTRFDAPR